MDLKALMVQFHAPHEIWQPFEGPGEREKPCGERKVTPLGQEVPFSKRTKEFQHFTSTRYDNV
jgi:hypothetical protein